MQASPLVQRQAAPWKTAAHRSALLLYSPQSTSNLVAGLLMQQQSRWSGSRVGLVTWIVPSVAFVGAIVSTVGRVTLMVLMLPSVAAVAAIVSSDGRVACSVLMLANVAFVGATVSSDGLVALSVLMLDSVAFVGASVSSDGCVASEEATMRLDVGGAVDVVGGSSTYRSRLYFLPAQPAVDTEDFVMHSLVAKLPPGAKAAKHGYVAVVSDMLCGKGSWSAFWDRVVSDA